MASAPSSQSGIRPVPIPLKRGLRQHSMESADQNKPPLGETSYHKRISDVAGVPLQSARSSLCGENIPRHSESGSAPMANALCIRVMIRNAMAGRNTAIVPYPNRCT